MQLTNGKYMIKISTLFKKDPNDLGKVINELNPENDWVFNEDTTATRKYDGTACAIINGELYKRYDVKKGKQVPDGAIACQEPDAITGHWPHWVKCNRDDKADKYHFEAFDKRVATDSAFESTYELIGPKINGNREKETEHWLIYHGADLIDDLILSFEDIREYLFYNDIEGIVFHSNDGTGRMCKIRKSDFGIKR